jgi:hypothetical protein
MRVDYAFLCDAASEAAGKVYALGIGVDRLHVRQLPARHGRLTFVCRLAFDAMDAGDRPFTIRLVDADGRDVLSPVQGQIHLRPEGATATGTKANLLVDLLNAEFNSLGPHELSLAIDGDTVATLPLEVART